MGQLVLLVVAAAWAAVLIPPLLRSRVENRPNSSVTDFRRQLNRLQRTVPARAGSPLRPVGRQLAPSARTPGRTPGRGPAPTRLSSRGGVDVVDPRPSDPGRSRSSEYRVHRGPTARRMHQVDDQRRRRTNVLAILALTSISTLFLAATTKSAFMLYTFAIVFLALCGYVYLLSQIRQRERRPWGSDPWGGSRYR